MTDDQEKRNRDLELLKGAVHRDRQRGKKIAKKAAGRPQSESPEILYRGQPVAGRGGRGGAPGSSGITRPTPSSSDGSSDVKGALAKLTNLFNEGLISQSEYDAKRSEILDRI